MISIPFAFCIWHTDCVVHIGAELDTVVSQKPTLLVRRTQSLIRQKCLLLYLALSIWMVPGPIEQSTYTQGMKSCSVEINRSFTLVSRGAEVSPQLPSHLECANACFSAPPNQDISSAGITRRINRRAPWPQVFASPVDSCP